jgi:tetratricopeptide (TPR) repeat protein
MSKLSVRFAFMVAIAFGVSGVVQTASLEPAAAHAKKAKPKGKKDDKKADSKSDEKKAPAAAEPKKEDQLRTTGPANIQREAFDAKKFDRSSAAEKKRDEAISEIKTLLGKLKPTDSRRGELIFRLAEIYWAKSKFIYQTEFKEFDEAYQKWVDTGRNGKEPQLGGYTKESEVYKQQSLKNYKTILDEFDSYPRLDEVLYIMAFNQYEAGKTKEAVENYARLIKNYDKSEYVSDSYLALGEHYFKANDLPKATKAYQKAYDKGIEVKRRGVYNYARYKLAWCDFNAQEYDKALSRFKEVVSEENKALNTPECKADKAACTKGIQLKREALNDMVLTYSRVDATKDAYDYLKKEAGKEDAYRLTGKLSQVYHKDGKYALEIETLRMLVNIDPDAPFAPDYQSSIVLAYSQLGDRPAVRKEVTRLVELYRPGSAWWRKNEANANLVDRARTVAESRMRELVTDYHRYAQKFKKVDDYETAADIYSQYLQAFPDSENAYRLNYFFAEVLWDLGRWRDSAKQYDAVVKRDGKGEYSRLSAFNNVLAWENIVNKKAPPAVVGGKIQAEGCSEEDAKADKCKAKDGKIGGGSFVVEKFQNKQKGDKKFDPQPIPEDEVALAAACDQYVAIVPPEAVKGDAKLNEELVTVKYKAAYIYQSRYHFDEGSKRYGELIERWPDTKFARSGADQILDSYAFRENYPQLEKWSRDFSTKKTLMGDKKFSESVYTFMEGATFKNTDALREQSTKATGEEKTKLSLQAADKFEAFLKEFPASKFAAVALYNTQLLYAGEKQLDRAIDASNRLLKDYAKEIATGENLTNKLEETTILNLAAYHEKMANYPTAAETYVRFADKYKSNAKAPDAIYNAAVFYQGLGDTKNAVALFARYIKDFPTKKDIPEVYLKMAGVYEDQDDWKRSSAMYGEFEKLHGKNATKEQILNARYRTALSLQKAGRDKDMLEACGGILNSYKSLDDKVKKSDIGQLAGGYCAFHALESEFQQYKAIRIESKNGAQGKKAMQLVKEALDDKKKGRDVLAKKYLDVLSYGSGEWGIAGLSRAADCLLDYVNTLRNAPDPAALANNPEAVDLFRTELENIAFPVEEQAIGALEGALTKAFELGIYSPYTVEIEDKLKKFKPAKFGRTYELGFYPSAAVSAGR